MATAWWKSQHELGALILDAHHMRCLESERQRLLLLLELTSGAHRVRWQAEGSCQRQQCAVRHLSALPQRVRVTRLDTDQFRELKEGEATGHVKGIYRPPALQRLTNLDYARRRAIFPESPM